MKPGKWGSFLIEKSVDQLINEDEPEYSMPMVTITYPSLQCVSNTPFGNESKQLFRLDPDWIFLNHGAFGSTMKLLLETSRMWQDRLEVQPLRFIDREILPLLVYSIRELGNFLKIDRRELILITNATTGLNIILNSLQYSQTDAILSLSIGYGATKKILREKALKSGCHIIELVVKLPITEDSLIQQVEDLILNNEKEKKFTIKLALFEHINSSMGIVLPVKKLASICSVRGIEVLIDGAHAMGQIDLNIQDLGVNYYVSNLHKWFSLPKGAGFLWVKSENQHKIHPLIVSHGYGASFTSNFLWTGMQDYSSLLTIPFAITLWNEIGYNKALNYMHKLALDASELLMKSWNTGTLAPSSMFRSMYLVQIPDLPHISSDSSTESQIIYEYQSSDSDIVQNYLHYQYKIECPVKYFNSHLFVRISCHIYNSIEQYQKLADVVLEMISSPQFQEIFLKKKV